MSSLSEKQRDSILNSNAKINIWEGAVRSGKTHASLIRFLKELTYGKDGEYAIITRTADSFKRNILPLIMRMVGVDARFYSGKRELHLWGKTIHIIGADDDRAESKIRGVTFQGAYVDEATIIPETVFRMLISRCSMHEAKIFATTNPDSPYHWLKTDYLDANPDVRSWQFTLEDNPELLREEKDYLRRQYKGVWYKRFIEGLWVQAEGAIYDFFEEEIHTIVNPPEAHEYICGIDYGTTNPCAFILIGINRTRYPNLWVEQEYYFDSRAMQRQKTDAEYCHDLKAFLQYKNVSSIYIDPSAASFKQELMRAGFGNVIDAQNEVNDGIRLVSNYVSQGTLKIGRNCTNLIKEFQSYVWDTKAQIKGLDKPLKVNDHALDALRYALYTHCFGKDAGTLKPEEWEKHREELFGNQFEKSWQRF